MGESPPATTASDHGPRWGARARDWADLAAGFSAPAWEAVARSTGIGPGMRVLDVGCGSGEFCRLAVERGAAVSGIDAAPGMIEVARRRAPGADLRVGPMERLPWADDTFDVVTGFNAFQFSADFVAALADARRVTRPGGRVAICNWGPAQENGLSTIMGALGDLRPPPAAGPPSPAPPALGEPGVLEGLARRAGLEPVEDAAVDVPFEARDEQMLIRALLAPGGVVAAIEHSGEERVRRRIADAAAPFRRADGSYRIDNRFRLVICSA